MSFRAGFVGLIGLPNAGKSSLVNAIVGEKVGIVSQKPQTTRQRVVGIYTDKDAQLIFVDAPGVINATSGLNRFLKEECESVIQDSDALVAVLNIDENEFENLEAIAEKVAKAQKPWVIAITKTDLPKDHRIRIIKERLNKYNVPIISGSILTDKKEFCQQLVNSLKPFLPETTAPLFDPEQYTTQTLRDLAAEFIREKGFLNLHQEIPYGMAVRVKRFIEDQGPVVKVAADILVQKENHRSILIGAGGQMIRKIGEQARLDLEKVMGRKVYLELFVTVKKNWSQNEQWMKELGYVVPERQ